MFPNALIGGVIVLMQFLLRLSLFDFIFPVTLIFLLLMRSSSCIVAVCIIISPSFPAPSPPALLIACGSGRDCLVFHLVFFLLLLASPCTHTHALLVFSSSFGMLVFHLVLLATPTGMRVLLCSVLFEFVFVFLFEFVFPLRVLCLACAVLLEEELLLTASPISLSLSVCSG